MHEPAARVPLGGDGGRVPHLTEVARDPGGRDGMSGERRVHTVAAFQDGVRPLGAGGGEAEREESGVGGEAGVQGLGVAARVEEFEESAGAAAREAEGVGEHGNGGAVQDRGGDGGGEDARDLGGVQASGVEAVGGGQPHPDRGLVSRDGGGEDVRAGRGGVLGGGQQCGEHGGRGVDECAGVGVVEVEGVDECAGGQCGGGRADQLRGTGYRGFPRAAESPGGGQCGNGRVRPQGGEQAADAVQQLSARGSAHDAGHLLQGEPARPAGDQCGGRNPIVVRVTVRVRMAVRVRVAMRVRVAVRGGLRHRRPPAREGRRCASPRIRGSRSGPCRCVRHAAVPVGGPGRARRCAPG